MRYFASAVAAVPLRYVVAALILTLLALLAFAAEPVQVPAGDVSEPVTWRAPTENVDGSALTDLAGHKLYWGFASRDYFASVDVPGGTPGGEQSHNVVITVSGNVGDVVTVFIAATAYDEHGNESGFSNEISRQFEIVDATVPNPPTDLMFGAQITWRCVNEKTGEPCALVPIGVEA